MGGALVRCTDPAASSIGSQSIEFELSGADIMLTAQERGRQLLADGSALIRLQFESGQVPQLARLATALFGTLQPSPTARDIAEAAATAQRRKEERRAANIAEIRARIADGTLVLGQMTVAQHEAASQADRESRAKGSP
jgi:hypothetical protein